MLFSSAAKHHAAGWRSRQRQKIRGTQERRRMEEGEQGVLPDRKAHVLSCPLSSPPLSPAHGRGDCAQLLARNEDEV